MALRDLLNEIEKEKAIKKSKSKLGTTTSTSPPVVNSVELTNSSKYRLGLGAHIEVMVTLSEPVIVKEEGSKPTLKIQLTPGVTRDAKYKSGSGTAELIFRYTVGENPDDSSGETGISVPAGSIWVPDDNAIEDYKGRPTNLEHPAADAPTPPLRVTDDFNEDNVKQAIGTLSRSTLPTVVVEGENDPPIYRKIEDLLGKDPYIDSLPVGGRDNLLEIYERKEEFPQVPVAFMADPDMWVLEDPFNMLKTYEDIIWTAGYSLENDLYADGNPLSLIPPDNLSKHTAKLNCAIRHFVEEEYSDDPSRQVEYYARISANPALKFRGKTLLEVLKGFCSPKYNDHLEMCKRIIDTVRNHHPLLSRLVLAINTEINKHSKKSSGSATMVNRIAKKYPS